MHVLGLLFFAVSAMAAMPCDDGAAKLANRQGPQFFKEKIESGCLKLTIEGDEKVSEDVLRSDLSRLLMKHKGRFHAIEVTLEGNSGEWARLKRGIAHRRGEEDYHLRKEVGGPKFNADQDAVYSGLFETSLELILWKKLYAKEDLKVLELSDSKIRLLFERDSKQLKLFQER